MGLAPLVPQLRCAISRRTRAARAPGGCRQHARGRHPTRPPGSTPGAAEASSLLLPQLWHGLCATSATATVAAHLPCRATIQPPSADRQPWHTPEAPWVLHSPPAQRLTFFIMFCFLASGMSSSLSSAHGHGAFEMCVGTWEGFGRGQAGQAGRGGGERAHHPRMPLPPPHLMSLGRTCHAARHGKVR
jgi:hypothetical protein